jgi:hypothetical protein
MAKIVLISCVSRKLPEKSRARDLYISPLFRYNLKYASSLNPEKIFILSAKYGLLKLDDEIEPYEKTLNKMPSYEIKKWASSVIERLGRLSDLEKDDFIFLAGDRYRKYLIPYIKNYEIPMKGLGIGRQLRYLKERVK